MHDDCGVDHDAEPTGKRWFHEEPWKEMFERGWDVMTSEEKQAFIAESWQQHLKEQYESSLEFRGVEGAPWEELSQDQKDSVEATVRQHAKDMQEFGEAIAAGKNIDVAGKKLIGSK
jgi:hypothetical protein